MDARPVIIVGREDTVGAYSEALAARELASRSADLGSVEAELRAHDPIALVLVSLPGDAAARMVGHVRRKFGAQLPIVVSLGRKDLKLRDRCLEAGAYDVSIEGAPDAVASIVDTAVNGWLRSAPMRSCESTITILRQDEPQTLRVTDIDPTGVGFDDGGDFEPDELLRLSLSFTDGELLLWGRVSHASGDPGIRFVATTTDDRMRLTRLLRKGEFPQAPRVAEDDEIILESRVVWPPDVYDVDATELAARTWVEGLELKWSPGVPPPEFLHEFLAALPSLEQRVFDAVPPLGFANPLLFRRAQIIRMHLQSIARDGEELLRGGWPVELNTPGLTAIFVHVDQLLASLYKYTSDELAGGRVEHAEQARAYLHAVLDDVDVLRPITTRYQLVLPDLSGYTQVSPQQALPELPELAEATAAHERQQRQSTRLRVRKPARRRAMKWVAVAATVLITIGVATWLLVLRKQGPLHLGPEFAGHVNGVRELLVMPDEVEVVVEANWHPSPDDLEQLKRHLSPMGKRAVRIVDPSRQPVAVGEAVAMP